MKIIFITLGLISLLLSIRLLSSDGGLAEYFSLNTRLSTLSQEADKQAAANQLLRKEVEDLQLGSEAIETIARRKLGMIGDNEIFVRVIEVPEIPKPMALPTTDLTPIQLIEVEPEGSAPVLE